MLDFAILMKASRKLQEMKMQRGHDGSCIFHEKIHKQREEKMSSMKIRCREQWRILSDGNPKHEEQIASYKN